MNTKSATSSSIEVHSYKKLRFIILPILTGLMLLGSCQPSTKNKHDFKPGDKVYATADFVNYHYRTGMVTFRLIRPITSKDIDTMNLDLQKKQLLRQNLKPISGIKLIGCAKAILNDSLRKYKTALIGTYIKYISKVPVYGKSYTISIYGVKLDQRVLVNNYYYQDDPIPPNYMLADNNFYVAGREISDEELPQFFK